MGVGEGRGGLLEVAATPLSSETFSASLSAKARINEGVESIHLMRRIWFNSVERLRFGSCG